MTTTDTPRTMHATLNDHDAAALYQVYCDSVGGKAYDGKPLPDWDAFSSDPTKEKQSQAWRDVAHFAFYASEREKSQKLEAEVERLTKRPFGCKCETLREKVLGDGCDECNKTLVIEMLTDERDELEAEVERLGKLLFEGAWLQLHNC